MIFFSLTLELRPARELPGPEHAQTPTDVLQAPCQRPEKTRPASLWTILILSHLLFDEEATPAPPTDYLVFLLAWQDLHLPDTFRVQDHQYKEATHLIILRATHRRVIRREAESAASTFPSLTIMTR